MFGVKNFVYISCMQITKNKHQMKTSREPREQKLWYERGYEFKFLSNLSEKELIALYDTEFFYDVELDF